MRLAADRIAGAPISWGVCEVPGWGVQLPPDSVLSDMARIGFRATELGPDGYLPTDPASLRRVLATHRLALVAGFVPALLHAPDRIEAELARVAAAADLLAGAGAGVLVLAASTGGSGYEGRHRLDQDEWSTLADGIARVMDLGAERSLIVALHPHQGTAIEGAREVERLLERSPVSLCLDTGHLLVGGADPLEVARAASGRVAHVHLKDVSVEEAARVRAGEIGYRDGVASGMYRPLGEGDLDVAGLVEQLEDSGYGGWYVLEQDRVLVDTPDGAATREARASFVFLERILLKGSSGDEVESEMSDRGRTAMKRHREGKEAE